MSEQEPNIDKVYSNSIDRDFLQSLIDKADFGTFKDNYLQGV